MKGGVRLLVCCAQVVVVSGALVAVANCGGGERPLVNDFPTVDASIDTVPNDTPSGITLSGFDPAAGIVFGDNGLVNCGAQAPEKVITIENGSSDNVTFKAKITAGTNYYKLSNEEGVVPGRGEGTLQIIPSPIPQESDVTPDLYAGTVEITFATGEPPTVIRLHQTARGAIIKSTLANAANTFDFGTVKIATTGTQQFSLTNAGNVEVTANFALGTPTFKIDNAQTATVPLKPAETVSKTLTIQPVEQIDYTDTLALSFNSSAVHCKPPPSNTNLKGKGTTSVGVSPGTLNFGQVNCGSGAPYQVVTITSTAAMNFTPVLGKLGSSPYTLARDSDGSALTPGQPVAMGANATYKVRVIPQQIPQIASTANNAFGDTFTITTDVPNDTPHVVSLTQTAGGAILVMTPATIEINATAQDLGVLLARPFVIRNDGNVTAPYSVSITKRSGQVNDPPDGTFMLNVSTGNVASGASAQVNGTVNLRAPSGLNQQYTADIELQAPGAVLCADLPPKMFVSVKTPTQ